MKNDRKQLSILKSLKNILIKEKKALIVNDENKVITIYNKKKEFLTLLDECESVSTDEVIRLIEEIQNIQQDNLMLIEQSISYYNAYLSGITDGVRKSNNTYSKYGGMSEKEDVSLINQSM